MGQWRKRGERSRGRHKREMGEKNGTLYSNARSIIVALSSPLIARTVERHSHLRIFGIIVVPVRIGIKARRPARARP